MNSPDSGPRRIQLSRTRGYRMPPNTVKAARPGGLGNPFKLDAQFGLGHPLRPVLDTAILNVVGLDVRDRETIAPRIRRVAVEAFLLWVDREGEPRRELIRDALAGKNAACWCPLPGPGEPDICHAAASMMIAAGGTGWEIFSNETRRYAPGDWLDARGA